MRRAQRPGSSAQPCLPGQGRLCAAAGMRREPAFQEPHKKLWLEPLWRHVRGWARPGRLNSRQCKQPDLWCSIGDLVGKHSHVKHTRPWCTVPAQIDHKWQLRRCPALQACRHSHAVRQPAVQARPSRGMGEDVGTTSSTFRAEGDKPAVCLNEAMSAGMGHLQLQLCPALGERRAPADAGP
jgi:hypothetical protein